MSHRTWMAFYTADFLAKTQHLCPKQIGAYMLLIIHYWNHDGLPSNASQLARIARLSLEEWAEHESVLQSFFHDGWKHERIDEELEIAREKHEKRVEAGSHGGKQKASNARVLLEQNPSNALPTTTTTIKKERIPAVRTAVVNLEFEKFRRGYPKRKGSQGWPTAEKLFVALVKSGFDANQIVAAASKFAITVESAVGTEFVPMAETWLRKKCFLEFIPTPEEIERAKKTEEFLASRGFAQVPEQ